MKKVFTKISLLLFSFVLLCCCTGCLGSNEKKENIIPQNNISYTHLEIGNVIDEGMQTVFLNFSSDYVVTRMEIEGALLDENGNSIFVFNKELTIVTPLKYLGFPIRVDANLIKNIKSASFTKIIAYTTQEINI